MDQTHLQIVEPFLRAVFALAAAALIGLSVRRDHRALRKLQTAQIRYADRRRRQQMATTRQPGPSHSRFDQRRLP